MNFYAQTTSTLSNRNEIAGNSQQFSHRQNSQTKTQRVLNIEHALPLKLNCSQPKIKYQQTPQNTEHKAVHQCVHIKEIQNQTKVNLKIDLIL